MNPKSNKFEGLMPITHLMEKGEFPDGTTPPFPPYNPGSYPGAHVVDPEFHAGLVRPDGSPVPVEWKIFTEGELITIKEYTFKLVRIGEGYMVLEPFGPADTTDILAKAGEQG